MILKHTAEKKTTTLTLLMPHCDYVVSRHIPSTAQQNYTVTMAKECFPHFKKIA